MTKTTTKPTRAGFTIIEVVLVLAIAGLIMAMIFIGLPALQRSQRNTARRNDLSRFATALEKYLANNRRLPVTRNSSSFDTNFVTRYIDSDCVFDHSEPGSVESSTEYFYTGCSDQFMDPDGTIYSVYIREGNSNRTGSSYDRVNHHRIYLQAEVECTGTEGNTRGTSIANEYAASIKFEQSNSLYCIDNAQ